MPHYSIKIIILSYEIYIRKKYKVIRSDNEEIIFTPIGGENMMCVLEDGSKATMQEVLGAFIKVIEINE